MSYPCKPVLSLGRMEYAPGASNVIYHGKNEGAPGRGTVVYDPLEFPALAHLAEPREIRLRYYGAASSTIRRGGRKGRLGEGGAQAAGPAPPEGVGLGRVRAARRGRERARRPAMRERRAGGGEGARGVEGETRGAKGSGGVRAGQAGRSRGRARRAPRAECAPGPPAAVWGSAL